VDQVHNTGPWVHKLIIRWESSIGGSAARIRLAKGYEVILISIVDLWMDSPRRVSFLGSARSKSRASTPWLWRLRGSSTTYKARYLTVSFPTWSRPRGDCAGWTTFNGGRGSFRWHSGSKVRSSDGRVGGGSSSKRRIGAGGLGKVEQWRWLARRRRLGVGLNSHGTGHYL
jgi:hypothetical protein